ncbi:MAG: 3-dehydroquinate synthase [SAR324 cluster bacterium]|nr:3-dehydroquinate synthase [SAR324 cluster bacterium]
MDSISIKSHQGNYSVDFFSTLAPLVEQIEKTAGALVAIDKNVYDLYESFFAGLAAKVPLMTIEANEDNKTLKGAEEVLLFLQKNNATKVTEVFAIGGGIIQDIVGFAAHLYYRGLKWQLVPTTLLSIGDSCIGAKNGLNLGAYKNQIGSFHSPGKVLVCPDFIQTLTPGDVMSGYGEVLKLLLINSEASFRFMKTAFDQGSVSSATCLELVQKSLLTKKKIIEIDEYEIGPRKHLNYGHTFGHALETMTDHKVVHGLAVVFGIDLVNFYSFKKGWLAQDVYLEIQDTIKKHFSFSGVQGLDAKELVDLTRRDKKVSEGKLQLAVLKDFGKMEMQGVPFDDELYEIVAEYLAAIDIKA